jgi:antitoxin ParD1/3/4
MNDLTSFLPPELRRRMEQRIADAGYRDAEDYLRELVEYDLASIDEPEDEEKIAWLREQIDIGRASGIIDKDPREVIEDIIAERRARRG